MPSVQTLRDGYSNFLFFQALDPQVSTIAALNGYAVDIKGYDTATIVVTVGEHTGGGADSATSRHQLKLEHYNSDAAAWSEVYPSQLIHSVIGMAGAYSALNSGIWQSLASTTSFASQTYAVGYIGPHRTIRLAVSQFGAPSLLSIGAIAVLGLPDHWPVSEPVGN